MTKPMTDKERGLYSKYYVMRLDGTDMTSTWCFVLEENDPFALPALAAYAQAVEEAGNGTLARDLRKRIRAMAELQKDD